IVGLSVGVGVAHTMEDCFVAAQRGRITLRQKPIDLLLRGVGLLARIAKTPEAEVGQWEGEKPAEVNTFLAALAAVLEGGENGDSSGDAAPAPASLLSEPQSTQQSEPQPAGAADVRESSDRVLRLTAENLNRLLGLAGESLVESRWLGPFAGSLQRLKRHHAELSQQLDALHRSLEQQQLPERADNLFKEMFQKVAECQQFLGERLEQLDVFDRRSAHLSHRLYLEVLRARMRPFGDGVRRFPRMVRDLGRTLGKEVRLDIVGENTQVDRDIVERLETPLAHLLRNAVDHGCEYPDPR